MSTYFCSDPHAFHGNIMKYCRRLAFMTAADQEALLALESAGGDIRGFRVSDESIDNMNRGLAANINSRVGPSDVLWCLGDWVFGQGTDYNKKRAGFAIRFAAARFSLSGATTTIARFVTCLTPHSTRPRSAKGTFASP